MTQASPPLQSTTYTFDEVLEVNAFSQEKGWTDGLPIVPLTAAQVAACLEAAHLAPGEVIGVERVRQAASDRGTGGGAYRDGRMPSHLYARSRSHAAVHVPRGV